MSDSQDINADTGPYTYQLFPKMLYHPELAYPAPGSTCIVADEQALAAKLEAGWVTAPGSAPEAPASPDPLSSVTEMTVEEIEDAVRQMHDGIELTIWLDTEQQGKARKGALQAIEDRLSDLSERAG